jgi:predicted NAD-dependent protein-ADP-ribosyltransferase YbiA (DUF1768 family)
MKRKASSSSTSSSDGNDTTAAKRPNRSFASASEYVTFYSRSANVDMRLLSNFATGAAPITIDFAAVKSMPSDAGSATFATGEHAFQGGKYRILALCSEDPGRAEQMMAHARTFEMPTNVYATAAEAKRAGGKRGGVCLTERETQHWAHHLCMELQEQICRAKLAADPRVAAVLRGTGDTYLVHHERATGGWPRYGGSVASKADDEGRRWMKGDNLLGEMWMYMRRAMVEDPL